MRVEEEELAPGSANGSSEVSADEGETSGSVVSVVTGADDG